MKQLYSLLLLWFFCALPLKAQSLLPWQEASPKYEMRAAWLATIGGIDWPHSYYGEAQREELRHTLDRLRQAGINVVLLQTRIRATTIFPSDMEPFDGCITGHPGKAPAYDPLQFVIDECHRRGMQLHAWIVAIPIGKWNAAGCKALLRKSPKMIKRIGEEGYLNPESPLTAPYLARFCGELTRRYDIDGLHLDYIRYPETWKWPATRREEAKQRGRAAITRIVSEVSAAVKREKPWVMMSCSPIGKSDNLTRYDSRGWNARRAVCQDAQQWLKLGMMDALMPMMYFRDNQFFPFAIDWQEQSSGRIVAPGLAVYFLDPKEGHWTADVITRQLDVLRRIGLGHTFFRTKFLNDNHQGIYHQVEAHNAVPALVPPMPWLCTDKPAAPREISWQKGRLSWQAPETLPLGGITYNVYASQDWPVDISKAENLVAARVTALSAPTDSAPRNYAVTATNRYGIESAAVTFHNPYYLTIGQNRPRCANRENVKLSNSEIVNLSNCEIEYLLIETLQGQTVKLQKWAGGTPDTTRLPDGIYYLRSLGAKGVNHRLALFIKKTKQ